MSETHVALTKPLSRVHSLSESREGSKVTKPIFSIVQCTIHTGPTPLLSPQTMLDAYVYPEFFRVSTLYRVGRENGKKISKKGALF